MLGCALVIGADGAPAHASSATAPGRPPPAGPATDPTRPAWQGSRPAARASEVEVSAVACKAAAPKPACLSVLATVAGCAEWCRMYKLVQREVHLRPTRMAARHLSHLSSPASASLAPRHGALRVPVRPRALRQHAGRSPAPTTARIRYYPVYSSCCAVQPVDLLCLCLAAGQQQPPTGAGASAAAAAGGACAARARRPVPPVVRVLLAAPLAARARGARRPRHRQGAAAVPASRMYAPSPSRFLQQFDFAHSNYLFTFPWLKLNCSLPTTVMTTSQIASCAFTLGTVAVLPFYTLMVVAPNANIVSHLPPPQLDNTRHTWRSPCSLVTSCPHLPALAHRPNAPWRAVLPTSP
jgi:hypothetical protein